MLLSPFFALEAYAEEDKIDEQLAAYFKLLSPEVQENFREILQKEYELTP